MEGNVDSGTERVHAFNPLDKNNNQGVLNNNERLLQAYFPFLDPSSNLLSNMIEYPNLPYNYMPELSEIIMRYAIFSDIHANLEALEAVLAKIDELAQDEPIDQIWFLGDLVGYGPNPNECILKLRERTDVIIAGNHDWAAVGKIDLEDFSAAARISAEWTAEQLTGEHRTFLADLPERLELGKCTLVHGSPFGPLWEYLTSEVLAERSFQYFTTRYCLVGHTHVPVIFQQPDPIANTPTLPLESKEPGAVPPYQSNGVEHHTDDADDETAEMVTIQPPVQQSTHSAKTAGSAMSAFKDPESGQTATEDEANAIIEEQLQTPGEEFPGVEDAPKVENTSNLTEALASPEHENFPSDRSTGEAKSAAGASEVIVVEDQSTTVPSDLPSQNGDISIPVDEISIIPDSGDTSGSVEEASIAQETDTSLDEDSAQEIETSHDFEQTDDDEDEEQSDEKTPAQISTGDEDQINSEIEELLTLLGLSQSMIKVTNEMITPPEGHWEAPEESRAIINPGGVGQPRDGDPRAAFMIYDTERGFEFYRVPYPFEKTQEKIIQAGLPHYLAVRLAYGR